MVLYGRKNILAAIQSNTTLDWIKETLSRFPQDGNETRFSWYFVEETIKRYLKLKEHENANKKAFKIWDGKCS